MAADVVWVSAVVEYGPAVICLTGGELVRRVRCRGYPGLRLRGAQHESAESEQVRKVDGIAARVIVFADNGADGTAAEDSFPFDPQDHPGPAGTHVIDHHVLQQRAHDQLRRATRSSG